MLTGLYAGNPKRSTNQPTVELLLKTFREVTLTTVSTAEFMQIMSKIFHPLQKQILSLLGFATVIHIQLTDDS